MLDRAALEFEDALYLNSRDITTLPTRKRFELMWEYLRDMWWGEALVFANYTPIRSDTKLRSVREL